MVLFPVIRVWTAGNVPVARNIGPSDGGLMAAVCRTGVDKRPLVAFVGGLHGSGACGHQWAGDCPRVSAGQQCCAAMLHARNNDGWWGDGAGCLRPSAARA